MIRAVLIVFALSSVSSMAFAQDGVLPPATQAQAQAQPQTEAQAEVEVETPGEAEFDAKADAFAARMQIMAGEMQVAMIQAGGDTAKKNADLDMIEARYQADVDDFAVALETFVNQQAAAVPEDQRGAMTASIAVALPQIRAYPQQIRAQVETALVRATEAAAAAVAAPAAARPTATE